LSVGEKATLKTRAVCPGESSRTSRPLAASHRRTFLPSAAAISWQSGEKRATSGTLLAVASNGQIAAPAFSTSQTLAVLSAPVVTSRWPSVEKRTVLIVPWWPFLVRSAVLLEFSFSRSAQILIVPSASAVANLVTSSEKASALMRDA